MNLKIYKSKRNFKKTAEPVGERKKIQRKKLQFVVQKHHARHLHYDFRLEMDNVLKSWAVPKGPSLNPEDKRLAIMVEDHPYEYKDFERTIPPENYGAGKVIIWDKGTYEILDNSTLEKGHFRFKLNGKKLKGEFSLIKLKQSEKNEWLLIKKAEKKTSKNFKSPGFIRPMLAHLTEKAFTRKGWLFEIKWDGYRILAYIINNEAKLVSRGGEDYTQIYQPVSKELAGCGFSAVLDGEIVVLDEEGYPHFQLLQTYQQNRSSGQLMYMVFDILWLNGSDLRHMPLLERKKKLAEWLPNMNHVRMSEYITTEGEAFFKTAADHGLEGIMAKDAKSLYLSGKRSKDWLKIKVKQKINAVIIGITQPRGSRQHIGALLLAKKQNNKLIYIGHTAGKLTNKDLAELKLKFTPYIVAQAPIQNPPKANMPVTWLKPVFHAEIEFSEWTEGGHLRHPVFNKLLPGNDTAKRAHFTHLDKLYWPKESYTKGDLIDYYRDVSEIILPYLKNRPQLLHRYPEGINGEDFYQKNNQVLPDWIKTQLYYSEHAKRSITYLVCQNKETLLFMANLGCIEMNPWLSKIKTPGNPNFCVLDLDPVNTAFSDVIQVAKAAQRVLEKIGITGFCKTSGKRGIHIYIPLKPLYDFEQSKQFAEILAILVQRQLPEITSLERMPSKRLGKVYIDFLQNRPHQTVVSPYSVRPVPGALISTPLKWSELNKNLNPQRFTMKTINKRLDKLGDLWENMMNYAINIDKVLNRIQTIYKITTE